MLALDGVDIAFITETWLTECSGDIIYTIKNYGFNIYIELIEEAKEEVLL